MRRTCTCSALVLLASTALAKVSLRSLTSDGAEFSARTYDYIIVGGGTAGLAIAARYTKSFTQSFMLNK